jgi:hypothetical protein
MLIALTPTMSARKVSAQEFSPRRNMRRTVASIALRTWKAIVGCLCRVPSGDREQDTLFPSCPEGRTLATYLASTLHDLADSLFLLRYSATALAEERAFSLRNSIQLRLRK